MIDSEKRIKARPSMIGMELVSDDTISNMLAKELFSNTGDKNYELANEKINNFFTKFAKLNRKLKVEI